LIPNNRKEIIAKMLGELGLKDVKELYSDVPQTLLLDRPPDIGKSMSQADVSNVFEREVLGRILDVNLIFTGGGIADHYVPALVDELSSRQEFYTSYTPYQPEVSQGVLQALFEYQSLMAELLGMDVVNASLYDYASALGEAGRFSIRVTKRNKIVLASTIHPERYSVLKTYVEPLGTELVSIPYDESGELSLEDLSSVVDESVAMVYVESPNFFGIIETRIEEISQLCHDKGALLAVGVDPLSLGLVKPPGEMGADIVIGEGQHLGGYMNYGGPSLGIFAIKRRFRHIRQMPGRLIGITRTVDGKFRGYSMVLQTREQHIRQEEATSNITTNSSLMAIRAAIYLSLLGPDGIRKVSEKIFYNTLYLKRKINELPCFKTLFPGSISFKEIPVIADKSWEDINKFLLSKGILGGFIIGSRFPELDSEKKIALFSTTEVHTKKDLDYLIQSMREVC